MTHLTSTLPARLRQAGPWFVDRPPVTVAASALLFAATLALRLALGGAADTSPLLFCLPIALLAAAFGLVGGLAAGLVSVGLMITESLLLGAGESPLGWAVRAVPLLLLGLLLGHAMDQLRRAEAEQILLAEAERRHHEAVQLNDTIVQSLAAAKWALEGADLDAGLAIVTQTLQQSNRMVSDLIRGAELRPLWMGEPTAASGPPPTTEGTVNAVPRAS